MTYRLPTTKLELPNTFEDIKFPVNRIADNITFNSKIQLIDENFNKLLEYCNVVDNKSPFEYDEFYSFDDGEIYQLSSMEIPPILDEPSVLTSESTILDSESYSGFEDFTIQVRLGYIDYTSTATVILAIKDGSSLSYELRYHGSGGQKIGIRTRFGLTLLDNAEPSNALLTLVRSGSNYYWYVDGVLVDEDLGVAGVGPHNVTNSLLILGSDTIDTSEWKIWDTAIPIVSEHGYKHVEVVDTYVETQLIICATSNRIDFYTTNVETSSNLGSATQYDKVKDRGSMEFKNISYIKYNDEKLYVYDNVYKNIYVYSLLSFLTNDTAISSIKFLRQFYKINLTAFDFNSEIFGITDSKLIKYNNDFNVKSEYVLDETNPIDIIISDNIYILYGSYIDVYNSLVNKINRIPLVDLDNDTFKSIEISKFDDSVLYIISDKYIYKYNTGGQFIGYFNVLTNGLSDFSILEKSDFEYVFALDGNKLHIFKDKIVTFKLYDEKNLLDKEPLDNLQIRNLELEQDFVYNSILQKAIFNVFLLYNSLILKPFVQTDSNGVLTFDYLENLVNTEVLQKNDIFYGQNEVFSYQTFNRAFREIYTIQEKILELIEFGVVENTTNTLII